MTARSVTPHRWRHPAAGTVLHWLLVAAAVAYIGYQAPELFRSVSGSGRWVRDLDWGWLPLALVSNLASISVYAELHRQLLAVGDAHVPAGAVQAITYAENAVANTVPVVGGAGAVAYAISRFHRRGADSAVASWAVLLAGLLSTLCLLVLGAVGLAQAGRLSTAVAALVAVGTPLAGWLGWAVVTHPPVLRRLLRPVLRAARRLPVGCHACRSGWSADVDATVSAVTGRIALLRPTARRWLAVIGLAVLSWLLDLAGLASCAAAVLHSVPWAALLVGFLVVQASIALQVLPGGAGLAEVGLLGAMVSAGVPAGAAAVVVLAYRISSWLLPSVIGWLVYARQIHVLGSVAQRHGPQPAGVPRSVAG